ncbi:DUF2314 domain-containing protein [Kordia sp.]|uniref:DUF2314 domain-containing protein n=1 Tax=Kordia sp. TaxID=1965332 RepID=UPI003B5AF62D
MKHFFFFLSIISSFTLFSQTEDTSEIGSFSEVGLYTMDEVLDVNTLRDELKVLYPDATFISEPPKTINKTMVYLSAIDNVSENYPVYEMEFLDYFAEGFTLAQKKKLIATKNAVLCVIFYKKKDAFTHHKKFTEWIYETIKDTDFVAYDGETREYFLPETWKTRRVDTWENGLPSIVDHITGHSYRQEAFCRTITLGMQRFGLPDLVIENTACSNVNTANHLITVIAQLMIEGQEVTVDDFEVNLKNIKSKRLQEMLEDLMYENASKATTVSFKEATRDEGDPFNMLLEINFNNENYPNPQAFQDATFKELFGSEDDITHVNHNEEILAASERAKKRLPALRKLFNDGLDAGNNLLLKAPFTTDDGGNEWMWIEVTKWTGETIEGILQNEPYYIKDLKSGTKVTIQQADVFDYIFQKSDGTSEGNETGRLIAKYGN